VKRYSENILISYDGDFAGQKADLRGLEILKDEQLNVKVVPMPEGQDPDDVAKQGAAAYQKCLDEAMPLIDYKLHALERKYDLSKTDDKRAYIADALKIVATEESAAVREDLLKKLNKRTGVSYQALERDLQNVNKEQPKESPAVQTSISEVGQGADKLHKAARFIVAAKLFSAPYAKDFLLQSVEFKDEVHCIIADYICGREEAGERIRPSELFEVLDEDCAEFNAILDLNYGDKLTGDVAERFFDDSVKTVKRDTLERQIALYRARYETETDEDKRKEIAASLAECIRLKKKLR
jgi:DNA primase